MHIILFSLVQTILFTKKNLRAIKGHAGYDHIKGQFTMTNLKIKEVLPKAQLMKAPLMPT